MVNSHIIHTQVSGSDSTDTDYAGNASAVKVALTKVLMVPKTSVSTHASNYVTVTIKKGSTTLGSWTSNSSGGSALTAGTPAEITLTGTGVDLEIASGAAFLVDVTKAGTGPAYDMNVLFVMREQHA